METLSKNPNDFKSVEPQFHGTADAAHDFIFEVAAMAGVYAEQVKLAASVGDTFGIKLHTKQLRVCTLHLCQTLIDLESLKGKRPAAATTPQRAGNGAHPNSK